MRYSLFSGNKNPVLSISSIGFARNPQVTRFGPGTRNLYIVHFVLSGSGYFNGIRLQAGQGFLITPSMLEEYYPDPANPWEFLWVISNDSGMQSVFPLFHADPQTGIFSFDHPEQLRSVADTVILRKNTVCDSFELLSLFSGLLKNRSNDSEWDTPKSNAQIYLEAAVEYIQTNLFRPVTIQELTQFLGISQPYLYHLFRNRFDLSPKQYISQCKLHQAKKLLTETDLSVTQVAASVGFPDVLSFSKFFSAKVGVSPLHFRTSGCS